MMDNSPIDFTLGAIAQGYHPGTLAWIKQNRPNEWGIMLALEGEINERALSGDVDGLKDVLEQYRGLIHRMGTMSKTPRGET